MLNGRTFLLHQPFYSFYPSAILPSSVLRYAFLDFTVKGEYKENTKGEYKKCMNRLIPVLVPLSLQEQERVLR